MLCIDTDLSLLLSAKVHHNHLAWHEGVMKFMRCKTSWSIDIWLTWTFQSMTQLWPKSNLLTNRNFLLFNSWVWSKRNVGQVFLLFFQALFFVLIYQTNDQNKVNLNFSIKNSSKHLRKNKTKVLQFSIAKICKTLIYHKKLSTKYILQKNVLFLFE